MPSSAFIETSGGSQPNSKESSSRSSPTSNEVISPTIEEPTSCPGNGPRDDTDGSSLTDVDVVRSGWMENLSGKPKRWRKRFFTLDGSGRLSCYPSEADVGSSKRLLFTIKMPCVLFVTGRREGPRTGPWPQGVSAQRCLNILTGTRTHYLICEKDEERSVWLTALRSAAGRDDSSDGIEIQEDESVERAVATRCTRAVRVRGERGQRKSASRLSKAGSMASLASVALLNIDYEVVDRFSMESLPLTTQTHFCKWNGILESSLRRLSRSVGLPEDAGFALKCDIGQMYACAPASMRGRLGELIFGDYVDELRHNLVALTSHPVGQRALLDRVPKHVITVQFKDNATSPPADLEGSPGHVTTACDGELRLILDRNRLGEKVHLTGCDFVDSVRIDVFDKTQMELSGPTSMDDLHGLRACVAVNVLNYEAQLQTAVAELRSTVPDVSTMRVECVWERLDDALRQTENAERGAAIARAGLAKLVAANVTVPMLQRLGRLCREDKDIARKLVNKLRNGVIEPLLVDFDCGPHGCMLSYTEDGVLSILVDVERVVKHGPPAIDKVDVRSWLNEDHGVIITEL